MLLDTLVGMLRDVGKRLMDWHWVGPRLVVSADSTVRRARCPACGHRSRWLRGRYRRLLAECPCWGHPVCTDMEMRRFQCQNRFFCSRRTFAKQVPELALPRQRCTSRLAAARRSIALALGGKEGSRPAEQLGMRASGDTLLRLLCRSPLPAPEEPLTAVGIEDWALARGHRYGTVVDLERHRPIARLPDRDTAAVSAWLKSRVGIQVVARDRAGAYANAVDQTLPAATQVADRWHLIKNLRNALERLVSKRSSRLREAAKAGAAMTPSSMKVQEKHTAPESLPPRTPAH